MCVCECTVPAQVDSHGQVPVTAVRVEAIVPQCELHQRDVRRVHALQRDARRADVPARLCDQVLQSLQHLLQDGTLHQASLEHVCCYGLMAKVRKFKFQQWFSPPHERLQEDKLALGFVLLVS